jgi:hypothetical protein
MDFKGMCSGNREILLAHINVAAARVMFLKAAHRILEQHGSQPIKNKF